MSGSEQRFCDMPALPGSLSGDRCGLTATDGSTMCWQHQEIETGIPWAERKRKK